MPSDPLLELTNSRVGHVLRGKWRLDKVIGIGGMASVYAATHRNGMRGAVKVLHPNVALDKDAKDRFLREGYVANRVEKGAVKVLDDDTTEDGLVFLVMELLDGKTVEDLANARPGQRLEIPEVVKIGQLLLEVLAVAHQSGVVHRDIKPENLFLTTQNELKVLDFGIARLREVNSNVRATNTASTMGTPAFMPPEQALAKWDDVGPRSDIYAVGASMFTLLTGQLTHVANTTPELLIAVATRQARPVRSLAPQVPDQLAQVVDRALAFDANSRWQTAQAMIDALNRASIFATIPAAPAAYGPAQEPRGLETLWNASSSYAGRQGSQVEIVGGSSAIGATVPLPQGPAFGASYNHVATPARPSFSVSAVTSDTGTSTQFPVSSDKPTKRGQRSAIAYGIIGAAVSFVAAVSFLGWFFFVRPTGTKNSATDSSKETAVPSISTSTDTAKPIVAVGEPATATPAVASSAALPSASAAPSTETKPSSSASSSSTKVDPTPPVPVVASIKPPIVAHPPIKGRNGLDLSRPD